MHHIRARHVKDNLFSAGTEQPRIDVALFGYVNRKLHWKADTSMVKVSGEVGVN